MSSAENAPVPAKDGRYLYRENGGTISNSDVLRQMIMENLQSPEIQAQAMANVVGQMNSPSVKEVINKHYPRDDVQAMKDLLANTDSILKLFDEGKARDKARDKAMSDVMKFKML